MEGSRVAAFVADSIETSFSKLFYVSPIPIRKKKNTKTDVHSTGERLNSATCLFVCVAALKASYRNALHTVHLHGTARCRLMRRDCESIRWPQTWTFAFVVNRPAHASDENDTQTHNNDSARACIIPSSLVWTYFRCEQYSRIDNSRDVSFSTLQNLNL